MIPWFSRPLAKSRSSNTANTASLLWHALHSLPSPSNQVNWAGFYVLDPSVTGQLILGPFMGKVGSLTLPPALRLRRLTNGYGQVACQTIKFGRGVCGAASQQAKTQLVPNVEEFPGHIACDGDSKSEIVVPIVKDGKVRPILWSYFQKFANLWPR